MTEVPPFLFIVTSSALILGVAIAIRGLLGFRPVADSPALQSADSPAPQSPASKDEPADALLSHATALDTPATLEGAEVQASTGQTAATGVRDLKEPIVMTIAGVFICIFSALAISALIHSV